MFYNLLAGMFSNDLAVDLGTANTLVYVRGEGIVLNEPSIVAFNTAKGQVEAVGLEAHEMLGRTPPNIRAVRPLRDGVIADFDAAEKMLVHFVKKAMGRAPWRRPRLVIGVPSEITQVERRAVRDSGFRVKASEVHLVDEPMAAAIGAGLPVTEAAGNMRSKSHDPASAGLDANAIRARAEQFLAVASEAPQHVTAAVGLGEDLRITAPRVAGAALVSGSHLVHLGAFAL